MSFLKGKGQSHFLVEVFRPFKKYSFGKLSFPKKVGKKENERTIWLRVKLSTGQHTTTLFFTAKEPHNLGEKKHPDSILEMFFFPRQTAVLRHLLGGFLCKSNKPKQIAIGSVAQLVPGYREDPNSKDFKSLNKKTVGRLAKPRSHLSERLRKGISRGLLEIGWEFQCLDMSIGLFKSAAFLLLLCHVSY